MLTGLRTAAVICSVLLLSCDSINAQESDLDGITVFGQQEGYRKNWALLIGINYTGRQEEIRRDSANRRALPELKNAANDAKAVADVLKKYYRYDEDAVVVLTDDGDDDDETRKPTESVIRDELNKLCLPGNVQPEDSVLIFFAGHGFKLDDASALSGNAVALLPYDVALSQGRPVGTKTFDLPDGLFELVAKIPAQHKLIVLDCCYSGEIFNARGNVSFQTRSEAANRSDESLQREPAFQAIASCRATQVASDGRDGNSRFTTAFLDGLKHIPARSDGVDRQRVWANRLLAYMRPSFDESQRPDCRNLIRASGEFCFYPRDVKQFSEFALHDDDKSHLKAMVVSRQGSWWFEEMPWFIPGIRSEIVRKHEDSQPAVRSASFSDLIRMDELKATAEQLIENNKSTTDPLRKLRYQHAQDLMQARDARKLKTALERIESDLSAHLTDGAEADCDRTELTRTAEAGDTSTELSEKLPLAPEDIHFLAVVRHALGKKCEAEATYGLAIKAYTLLQDKEKDRLSPHILAALCRADRGEFYLDVTREQQKAAKDFESARRGVLAQVSEQSRTKDSAAFFRIFMLCQEADAWLGVNRWSQANQLLAEAVDVAEALAPNHFLQAHVHRRRAWAKIIQWEIREAKSSFQRSNEILHAQFLREARDRGDVIPTARVVNTKTFEEAGEGSAAGPNETTATSETSTRVEDFWSTERQELGRVFRGSSDHASKIAFLHNLHGIAMATRFHGDTLGAARYYRWIAAEVEDAFTQFGDSTTDADLEKQFIGRVINTQERLGDCNLFGDPEFRDLKEAVDDYRRALDRVHLTRKWEARDEEIRASDRQRAALMYKQAIAFSVPSSVQDTALALEMCRRADAIYETQKSKATGLWQALGELTTKMVTLVHSTSVSLPEDTPAVKTSPDVLRQAILDYRDVVGVTPHRDQLEVCLFASKVLLEHSGPQDVFQTMADADLLLSFCRLALSPYRRDSNRFYSEVSAQESESRAYLRPYYDAVMRSKLRFERQHVKDLLEIQAEATRGTYYMKPQDAIPIIATYFFRDDCYLLVDLPQGESKCVRLSEMYDLNTIRAACESSGKGLPLPRDIHEALVAWRSGSVTAEDVYVELRWEDPIRSFGNGRVLDQDANSSRHSTARPIIGHFPFDLPAGFRTTQLVTQANVSEETRPTE